MGGFLSQWHQWRALMVWKKMLSSISPFGKGWNGLEMKNQVEEEENPRMSWIQSFHNEHEQERESEDEFPLYRK